MSRFDDLMEDFVVRAKNVADAAGKMTGDMVNLSRLKYQVKQTQWDIDKAYAKLGAFVYESKKSEEDFGELIDLAVGEIDLLNAKLEETERQILACRKVRKCDSCGKENEVSNAFCTRCGHALAVEADADEAAEDAAEVAEAMDEVTKAARTVEEAVFEEAESTQDTPEDTSED